MPGINIDLTGLSTAVAKVKGVRASVVEFVAQIEPRMQKRVEEALTADDAADQGSIDAANAAIAGVASELTGEADAITAAITTNPGPGDGGGETPPPQGIRGR